MSDRRGTFDGDPVEDDPDAAWASDDVPVRDDPLDIVWTDVGAPRGGGRHETAPGPRGAARGVDAGDADEGARRRGSPSRRLIGLGLAAALALVVAVVVWPRGGSDLADPPADRPPVTPDRLADPDGARVSDDEDRSGTQSDRDAADDGTNDRTASADDGDLLDRRDGGGAGGDDVRPASVEIPPGLASTAEPFEIVMQTSAFGLATVSLPSGTVRYATPPGGDRFDPAGPLLVGPDAVAISTGPSDAVVVPRTGPPVSVVAPDGLLGLYPVGVVVDEIGGTRFRFGGYGSGEGVDRLYDVGLDGSVQPVSDPVDPRSFLDAGLDRASGPPVVNDAGGVYRGRDGDVRRISEGRALTASRDHLLLRECDEARDCTTVVQSLDTGERSVVPDAIDVGDDRLLVDLSPDGRSLLTWREDDPGGEPVAVIVDLTDPDVRDLELPGRTNAGFSANTAWTPDSAGVLIVPDGVSDGVLFVDRSEGSVQAVATELGQVVQIGLRPVAAELPVETDTLERRPIDVGDRSTGTGIEFVALGEFGAMAHVDLDEASAAVWSIPNLPGNRTPQLVSSGSTVTVISPDGERAVLAAYGGGERTDDALLPFPATPRFAGPSPGSMWAPATGRPDVVDHRLVVVDGSVPSVDGSEIAVPGATLLGGDGRGLLVAEVGGASFAVGGDERILLTDGELLALGVDHALTRTCDRSLVCTVDLLDRSTGDILSPRPDVLAFFDATPTRTGVVGPPLAGTVSPDGGAAVGRFVVADDRGVLGEEWFLVDVVAGTRVTLPRPDDHQPFVWSDDGSTLVFLGDGTVYVVDRGSSSDPVTAIGGLGSVRAITAVDDDFRPDGD